MNQKLIKILLLLFILILRIIDIKNYKNINKYSIKNKESELDYNYTFAIIKRKIKISTRGLMAYYFINMGCAVEQIYKGFIPLIDLSTHPNIFNQFNDKSTKNPWEIFFNQPFNYTSKNVIKNAKNIINIFCERSSLGPHFNIFNNKILINYWQNIAKRYKPIKERYIIKANNKFNYLFRNSNNVLGILIRGTDYIAYRPFGHPIQPKPEKVFEDIIEMDNKNNYDFFF